MSLERLILDGQSDHTVFKALINRLSTLLGVDGEKLLLASTPKDAVRAVDCNEESVGDDRTGAGLLGLEDPLTTGLITLIRLGPAHAPISVLITPDMTLAAHLSEDLSQPPPALLQAGLDALRPAARLQARADRDQRDGLLQRAARQLESVGGVRRALLEPYGLSLEADGEAARRLADQFAISGKMIGPRLALYVPDAATAQRLADWLGAGEGGRTATVRRTTKETDIALSLDLDGEGGSASTGVHFFDHMLDQIGRHGGMRLDVVCEGDVEVDSHHTIEDVCLALGDALRQALGDKRGIARFGFETPMDETRASVWIDLSGRPFCRFEGDIPGERVGDFPVEMCEHAFRSMAETLKAAIHVKVDGETPIT